MSQTGKSEKDVIRNTKCSNWHRQLNNKAFSPVCFLPSVHVSGSPGMICWCKNAMIYPSFKLKG